MYTFWVSNRLDPDQAWHFVEPDLGPLCLQRLSADDTSRQRADRVQKCEWVYFITKMFRDIYIQIIRYCST